MNKRMRNAALVGMTTLGLLAAREASARANMACFSCIGIFDEHCEPWEPGEDGGTECYDGSNGREDCVIQGTVCPILPV